MRCRRITRNNYSFYRIQIIGGIFNYIEYLEGPKGQDIEKLFAEFKNQ